MAQGTDAQASSGDDENDRFYPPRTLQLLWGKREFSCYTELLEIPEILHLQSAEPPPPEAIHEVQQVSTNLELLCQRAASDHRYLGLATKDYLKSRMRENRTSGSVRGSRQSLRSKNYVKGVSRLSTRLSRALPINKEIVEVLWHSCARRRGWFGRTWQSRGVYWMKAGVQNK